MKKQLKRRDFLRGLGVVVGGALVIGPNLAGCEYSAADEVSSIGVYVPRDSAAAGRFVAGMTVARSSADPSARPTRLVIQDFDHSAPAPADLRAFIDEHQLDAVVALMNATAATPLVEVLRQTKTPLVLATAGLELVGEEALSSPWLYVASLGGWQASFAAGRYAATSYGSRAVIATSINQAGYDGVFAFHEGFARAGGAPAPIEFTDAPAMPRSIGETLDAIAAHRPQAVYAQMSGEAADEFAAAYRTHGALADVPLVGGAFFDAASARVERFVGWSDMVSTPQNRQFGRAFVRDAGEPADGFAALGADSHRWFANAADASAARGASHEALAEALATADFDGVRGRCRGDQSSGSLRAPVFHQRRSGAVEPVEVSPEIEQELLGALGAQRSGVVTPFLG